MRNKKLAGLTQLGKSGVIKPSALLESFPRPATVCVVEMVCDEVSAICPVTGQPDQYVVKITYTPDRHCIESKSLKLKLQSFRSTGAFGEELSTMLVKHVMKSVDPLAVEVEVIQKSRGGVSIKTTSRWIGIPNTPGVYKIVNLVNGNVYVGSSGNMRDRWCSHRCDLRLARHYNKHLQRAWNKYGEEAFRFDILQETDTDALLVREEYFIKWYEENNHGRIYNLCRTPTKGTRGLTWSHTKETKLKISASLTGKKTGPRSAEARKRMSEAQLKRNYKRSDESRRQQSERQRGKKLGPCSPETAAKIGAANKGKTKGIPKSPEHRAKIAAALKARKASDETSQQ